MSTLIQQPLPFQMEDNFLWFSILFSLILSVFFILKVGKRFKSKSCEKITSNLPPGPWKLPIFGSIHHLVGSLPHQRMRELSQKYGPLMHLKLGETSTIVVSSKEIAIEVLKTNGDVFAQRPRFLGAEIIAYGCTNIFFSPRGDYWRQLRKICTLELLSAKRVKSFQSIREEEVSNLIRYISMNTGSTINLTNEVSSMTYSIISRASFGDKCNDQEAFILFIKKCMRVVESFNVPNLFPSQHWLHVISGMEYKLKKLHRSGDMLLEKIINKETTKTHGSLLSYLLSLKDDGFPNPIGIPLTTNNIKAILQDMIIGGSDTSLTTIEWAFSEMLKNPRVMKKAQEEVRQVFGSRGYVDEKDLEELKYLKAVIKETLRLHSPIPLLLRECIKTCEINGYTIPAGTQVFVNVWAIGRDQKNWNDADKFYPERFLDSPIDSQIDYKGTNFDFIPFGAGKRMCPGALFAIPTIELPLAQLLYYFDWQFPSGTSLENFDMTEAFGNAAKRKSELLIIPIPYNP